MRPSSRFNGTTVNRNGASTIRQDQLKIWGLLWRVQDVAIYIGIYIMQRLRHYDRTNYSLVWRSSAFVGAYTSRSDSRGRNIAEAKCWGLE
jgi:hypothetical protein